MSGGACDGKGALTPPVPGSPDRGGDRSTLKVHLPDGRFNIVRYNDASDVKVRIRTMQDWKSS